MLLVFDSRRVRLKSPSKTGELHRLGASGATQVCASTQVSSPVVLRTGPCLSAQIAANIRNSKAINFRGQRQTTTTRSKSPKKEPS